MALVPADPFNVIPRRRLVAGVALVHLGVRLVGNLRAHLTEVRRSMTWRAKMAPMKRRWLPLEQRFVVRVADDTV